MTVQVASDNASTIVQFRHINGVVRSKTRKKDSFVKGLTGDGKPVFITRSSLGCVGDGIGDDKVLRLNLSGTNHEGKPWKRTMFSNETQVDTTVESGTKLISIHRELTLPF
jgi:hypothetical protein